MVLTSIDLGGSIITIVLELMMGCVSYTEELVRHVSEDYVG